MSSELTFHWWQWGIIYQVYPRSFSDSNGDGVGDLPGITAQLDYLQWLGVNALWLSPIFPSPMADFGYDITDYRGIDPLFGTLADFDALLEAAHARDLKVILDFVPNHTSDRHPWFIASRSSRQHPQRDWYLWHDAAPDGGPPNNWRSVFGGPAWTYDEVTGQYYYHAYLKEQPDLNWRNPEVQEEMLGVMRYWLKRGVDGFRVDALRQIIKDEQWRDNPPNPAYISGQDPYNQLLPTYTTDRPEVMEMVARMRDVTDAYPDRVLIGELYLPLERLVAYYGEEGRGVHLPFNFHLIATPWNARTIALLIDTYESLLPPDGWPNWVLSNHDQPRLATRIGSGQIRVAAMLLLTLRGTPTLYYGDEIGMHNVEIAPDQVQDPFEKNVPGKGLGRDPERTPMQWDSSPQAGFTTAEPWLPIAEDYQTINVAAKRADPQSVLSLYRRLVALRQKEKALAIGSYQAVEAEGDLLAYRRRYEEEQFLIVLNLGDDAQELPIEALGEGLVIISTHLDRDEAVSGSISLQADEGVVIRLMHSII